jgi:hypothetical protein
MTCQQERFAKTVSIHPFYDFDRLYNDVAVVHLQESFVLAPHIDTVCLPDAQNSRSSFQSNKCFASGWGKDRFGEFSFNFAGYFLETSLSSENCSIEINVQFFRVAVYAREKTNTNFSKERLENEQMYLKKKTIFRFFRFLRKVCKG